MASYSTRGTITTTSSADGSTGSSSSLLLAPSAKSPLTKLEYDLIYGNSHYNNRIKKMAATTKYMMGTSYSKSVCLPDISRKISFFIQIIIIILQLYHYI